LKWRKIEITKFATDYTDGTDLNCVKIEITKFATNYTDGADEE
jgi:hypothetical protein